MINVQTAAIPYRRNSQDQIEVLLVTSRKRCRWVLPKGKVKKGRLPHASAALEAFEEAGVIGSISAMPVGTYQQMKVSDDGEPRPIVVRAFPMKVVRENSSWPEMRVRQRRWLPIDGAIEAVHDIELRAVLRKFADAVPEDL